MLLLTERSLLRVDLTVMLDSDKGEWWEIPVFQIFCPGWRASVLLLSLTVGGKSRITSDDEIRGEQYGKSHFVLSSGNSAVSWKSEVFQLIQRSV